MNTTLLKNKLISQKHLFLFSLLMLLSVSASRAQCVMAPLTLEERVSTASLIVEAKVSGSLSYWNADRSMIFTAHTIAVSKVYKGQLPSGSINIITLGGTVNDKSIKVEPELELTEGEIGLFLLVEKNGEWVAESGPQGFIKIDKTDGGASDVFHQYTPFTIYPMVEGLTGQKATDVNSAITKLIISSKRASPTITSISPKTITAGTSVTLTVKGTNFKSAMDTSSVQFKNGDDGGLSYIKALKKDFISWSDTMIKLVVRTKAGTGKIRVLIGGNGVVTSSDTLKISYSHLNVVQGDSIGYETQEIGMNATNGITWKISKRFYDSSAAKGAFIRSLERWRCGTYINWDTLGTVNYSTIKSDGVNMCAWDTSGAMPSGVLAQCFSFWSGCFVGPNLKWFVNELDIRFRVKPTTGTNWNYSIGTASGTQYHFETVATHELGHGHQLGHVIAPAQVMHYSIANGQVKANLTSSDIAGGNYVITKSANAICSKSAHSKLNAGNCAIVPPSVNFSITKSTICLNENTKFTDSSKGNITAYSWNFGSGASPATSSTIGPHTVTYSSGGAKTISLTLTTSTNANINKTKNITVASDSFVKANFSFSNYGNNIIGFINSSASNNRTYKWYFGDGDSSVLANPIHYYTNANNKVVKLVVSGACNTDDTTITLRNFTGLSPLQKSSLVAIFPNPSNSGFKLWNPLTADMTYEISDISGKQIASAAVPSNATINTLDMANGIYILKVTMDGAVSTTRLIIQH